MNENNRDRQVKWRKFRDRVWMELFGFSSFLPIAYSMAFFSKEETSMRIVLIVMALYFSIVLSNEVIRWSWIILKKEKTVFHSIAKWYLGVLIIPLVIFIMYSIHYLTKSALFQTLSVLLMIVMFFVTRHIATEIDDKKKNILDYFNDLEKNKFKYGSMYLIKDILSKSSNIA